MCLEQQELAQTDGEMMRDSAISRTVLSRPHAWCYQVRIDADAPVTFDLSIRMPGWMAGPLEVMVDGEKADYTTDEHGFAHVVRTWHKQAVTIRIGKRLSCYPLPDDPDMVAFMDGPICLAGLDRRSIFSMAIRRTRRIRCCAHRMNGSGSPGGPAGKPIISPSGSSSIRCMRSVMKRIPFTSRW